MNISFKYIVIGVLFAILWASASAVAKFGLRSAEPLVLFEARFILAGVFMLFIAYFIKKERLPKSQEWKQLAWFGFFNITIYLSFFVFAVREVSAGIGTLATATNPLFISVLSAFWLKKKVKAGEWIAVFLGIIGVVLAVYPLLLQSFATPIGLLYLFISMFSYSVGTIYYANQKWELNLFAINGWQVLLGGLFLLPFAFLFHEKTNQFDNNFWLSVLWLAFPVSVVAVQLWLILLKINPVKASLWLFLCPIFGFFYGNILLNEPISIHTFVGTIFVLLGLYLGQKIKVEEK